MDGMDTAEPSHDNGLSDEDPVQEELNKKTEDGKDLMSRQKKCNILSSF